MSGFKEGSLQLRKKDVSTAADQSHLKILVDTNNNLYTVDEYGVYRAVGGGGFDIQVSGTSLNLVTSGATKILSLNDSGVVSGAYGSPTIIASFVVGKDGRIISAANVPISATGLGTVTSVGIASNSLVVSSSPITTFGDISVNLSAIGTSGIFTKVVKDVYGRIVSGGYISASDLPMLSAYTLQTTTSGISANFNTKINSISANYTPRTEVSGISANLQTQITNNNNSLSAYYRTSGGNISGNISASGNITGNFFIKIGGTSAQFLKANGSIDSNVYITSSSLIPYTLTTTTSAISGSLQNQINSNNLKLSGYLPLSGGNVYGVTTFGNASNNGYVYVRTNGQVGGAADIAWLGSVSANRRFVLRFNENDYMEWFTANDDGSSRSIKMRMYRDSLSATNFYTGLNVVTGNLSVQNLTASKIVATDASKNLISYTLTSADIPNISNTYLPLSGGSLTGQLNAKNISADSGAILGANLQEILRVYRPTSGVTSTWGQTFEANNNVDQRVIYTRIRSVIDGAVSGLHSGSFLFTVYKNGVETTAATLVNDQLKVFGTVSASGNLYSTGFVKFGGTNSQFLKADGSVDTRTYLPTSGGTLTGTLIAGQISATDLYMTGFVGSKVLVSDSTKEVIEASTSITEVNYLVGVSGNVQTQINALKQQSLSGIGFGTPNRITKFITTSSVGDSTITDTGSNVIISTTLSAVGNITAPQFNGNLNGYKNVDSGNETTLANGYNHAGGNLYINYRGATLPIRTYNFCNGQGIVYSGVMASAFMKSGGTNQQYLMADGSISYSDSLSNKYLPLSGGVLLGDVQTANLVRNDYGFADIGTIAKPYSKIYGTSGIYQELITDNVKIFSTITPDSSFSVDLGSNSLRFRDLYIKNLVGNSFETTDLSFTSKGTHNFGNTDSSAATHQQLHFQARPMVINTTSGDMYWSGSRFFVMDNTGTNRQLAYTTDLSTYASASSLSNYLPLSGGTITGDVQGFKFTKTGGLASQYLMANGSVSYADSLSNKFLPLSGGNVYGVTTFGNASNNGYVYIRTNGTSAGMSDLAWLGSVSVNRRFVLRFNENDYMEWFTNNDDGSSRAAKMRMYRDSLSATNFYTGLNVVTGNLSVQNLTASKIVATDASKNLISYTLTSADIPNISNTYLPLSGGSLTGNLRISAVSESWSEGLRIMVPENYWGGLRLTRNDSLVDTEDNWAVGYANNDSGNLEVDVYTGVTQLKHTIFYKNGNTFHVGDVQGFKFTKTGGTSQQYLMADGSVSYSDSISDKYLPLSGGTLTGNLFFSNPDLNTFRGIRGQVGTNDFWGIRGGAGTIDEGFVEIFTEDNGHEPIYVKQYNAGVPSTILTLLDASNNTYIPNDISVNKLSIRANNQQGLFIGDNASLGDCDTDDSIRIQGQQHSDMAYFVYGNNNARFGFDNVRFTINRNLRPIDRGFDLGGIALWNNWAHVYSEEFVRYGGTNDQFLMADGSVSYGDHLSNKFLPLSGGTMSGAVRWNNFYSGSVAVIDTEANAHFNLLHLESDIGASAPTDINFHNTCYIGGPNSAVTNQSFFYNLGRSNVIVVSNGGLTYDGGVYFGGIHSSYIGHKNDDQRMHLYGVEGIDIGKTYNNYDIKLNQPTKIDKYITYTTATNSGGVFPEGYTYYKTEDSGEIELPNPIETKVIYLHNYRSSYGDTQLRPKSGHIIVYRNFSGVFKYCESTKLLPFSANSTLCLIGCSSTKFAIIGPWLDPV